MRKLILFLLLTGCTTLPSADPTSPDSIETKDNNFFGTVSTTAPSVLAFDSMSPQNKKVFIECAFKAKDDPDSDQGGKAECEKEAGRLMLSKKFIVVSAPDASTERWLFRFEETRKRPGYGRIDTPFDGDNYSQMWGTLSRFKPGATKPFSHILVSGVSQYERGVWQPTMAKQPPGDWLMVILIKSMMLKAVNDPTAGAKEIE